MKRDRDDFTQKVKTEIAKRAGYMCSWPACEKLTERASEDAQGAVSIGVAAHIRAASPGGPRYDPCQTPEERTSAGNGIWLCQDHAHLVDADTRAYGAQQLLEWKRQHEERVRKDLATQGTNDVVEVAGEHVARGKGNVTGLDIQGPAIIKPGTRSVAEGEGNITATRIGQPRRTEEK